MGAPSLSVRWYAANKAHKLPDGQLEMYASAGDFIKQTLDTVYQPHMKLVRPVTDIEIKKIGKAKYFLVTSPARVPADLKWGTVIDADSGQPYNVRKHAYVVIPAKGGFYVLVYPATEEGYEAYKDKFDDLVYKFQILKDGPGQPAKPAKR